MSSAGEIDLESLSALQAQRAILLVYDLLPDAAWAGGAKASLVSFDALGDDLLDATARDAGTSAVVKGLIQPGNDELKGAVARHALQALAQDPTLRPIVFGAAARSTEPDMMSPPEIVGACIIAMSLLPKYETTDVDGKRTTKWLFDPTGNAALLLDKLTALVKALPAKVVASLSGS